MVIFYDTFRPEVSKKGNCVAEWLIQKPKVLHSERHRGRDLGVPFPAQERGHPVKPAGNFFKKKKKVGWVGWEEQMCSVIKTQLRKWNFLAQDALDPTRVPGDALSMPTYVGLQIKNYLSSNGWCLGEYLGKHCPAFPHLSWSTPRQLLWVTVGDGIPCQPLSLTSESRSHVLLLMLWSWRAWGVLAGPREEILYLFSEYQTFISKAVNHTLPINSLNKNF